MKPSPAGGDRLKIPSPPHHNLLLAVYERTLRWSRAFLTTRDSILSLIAALLLQPILRQTTFFTVVLLALAARQNIISPITFTALLLLASATFYIFNFFFLPSPSSIRPKAAHFGRYTPRFYLCWTTHARFYPLKYRFNFPLLYVGFPAQMSGATSPTSRMFSVLPPSQSGSPHLKGSRLTGTPAKTFLQKHFTFFTIDPSRYFNPTLPFNCKLDSFLMTHGKNPADYPHIYVVTTPAFLGISHNPVSFYQLYTKDHSLAHTVFEVNNTFDGSILYLLTPDTTGEKVKLRKGYSMAGRIDKVLAISPFNKPIGHYEMQILDPLRNIPPEPSNGETKRENSDFDVLMVVFDDAGRKTMACNVGSRGKRDWDMMEGGRIGGIDIAVRWGMCAGLALPRTLWLAMKMIAWGAEKHKEVSEEVDYMEGSATSADVPRIRKGVWKSGMEGK